MTISEAKDLLTKEELAIKLKVSCATINRWIMEKRITPVRIGKRCLFPVDTEISEVKNTNPIVNG